VDFPVASGAESDQVFLGIVSQMASGLDVMNLKPSKRPAELAAPAVALKDLSPKLPIGNLIQSQQWSLLSNPVHEASRTRSKSCRF
jgi:hypothetical protein